jgi:hypothetical protein
MNFFIKLWQFIFRKKRQQYVLRAPIYRNDESTYEYYHPNAEQTIIPATVWCIEEAWHFDSVKDAKAAIQWWIHEQNKSVHHPEIRRRREEALRAYVEVIPV